MICLVLLCLHHQPRQRRHGDTSILINEGEGASIHSSLDYLAAPSSPRTPTTSKSTFSLLNRVREPMSPIGGMQSPGGRGPKVGPLPEGLRTDVVRAKRLPLAGEKNFQYTLSLLVKTTVLAFFGQYFSLILERKSRPFFRARPLS